MIDVSSELTTQRLGEVIAEHVGAWNYANPDMQLTHEQSRVRFTVTGRPEGYPVDLALCTVELVTGTARLQVNRVNLELFDPDRAAEFIQGLALILGDPELDDQVPALEKLIDNESIWRALETAAKSEFRNPVQQMRALLKRTLINSGWLKLDGTKSTPGSVGFMALAQRRITSREILSTHRWQPKRPPKRNLQRYWISRMLFLWHAWGFN